MIKVCDAIMGSGKTTAAINYIKSNPEKKFIFVTQYLDEVKRVRRECKYLGVLEPRKLQRYNGSKILHTHELVEQGRSFATTHKAFEYYTDDLIDLIKSQQYILIIDECVNILAEVEHYRGDINLMVEGNVLKLEDDKSLSKGDYEYEGGYFDELVKILESKKLTYSKNRKSKEVFLYWQLPADLISAFDETYILTYMFEGQELHTLLEINKIPYTYIGVNANYEFCDVADMHIPEHIADLPNKIHILDNQRMNKIGESHFALSKSWFNKNPEGVKKLKNHTYNFFRRIYKDVPGEKRMWATHLSMRNTLRGAGYSNGFVVFNERATNKYKDKIVLAYCINVFVNSGHKIFYRERGVDIDEDKYALSTMIQWIWRSAIRDGKDIWVYIPSKRMRDLLEGWIKEVSASARGL